MSLDQRPVYITSSLVYIISWLGGVSVRTLDLTTIKTFLPRQQNASRVLAIV